MVLVPCPVVHLPEEPVPMSPRPPLQMGCFNCELQGMIGRPRLRMRRPSESRILPCSIRCLSCRRSCLPEPLVRCCGVGTLPAPSWRCDSRPEASIP